MPLRGACSLCPAIPQLSFAAAERLPSQDCRCIASVRYTLQPLCRALPRSADVMPCYAGASLRGAVPCCAGALTRFVVHGHAVPVQDLSLFPNAKPLRCSATQCRCAAKPTNAWAMLCCAMPCQSPALCSHVTLCRSRPMDCYADFACAIRADPCRSAASAVLRWPVPLPYSEPPVRALPAPISAMQSAGEQCRCGAFGCLA